MFLRQYEKASRPDPVDRYRQSMPPGTHFLYLNRPCIVHNYVGYTESEFTCETAGLHFRYTDDQGIIHAGVILTRNLDDFARAGVLK